jgi:hypothetical protein
MLKSWVTAFLICAATVSAGAPGSSGAAADCRPLPTPLLATYHRADDRNWELEFRADCTFRAAERGQEEGGGDYTLTAGDESAGTFVFSNDRGCRDPGMQDLPTPYSYSFRRRVLALAVVGGNAADLCIKGNEGRAQDLAGHGGWIELISGRVTIALKGTKPGSFSAKGAFVDKGTFTVIRSKKTRNAKIASLRLAGANGTLILSERIVLKGKRKGKLGWDVVGKGFDGYAGMVGTGAGRANGTKQTLTGYVSN